MVSPIFSTGVSLDNALVCHMIVALELKASDWLTFAFGYQHLLVADDKAVEDCFVYTGWIHECDNYVSYHFVWVSVLGCLSPSALANRSFGQVVCLSYFFYV